VLAYPPPGDARIAPLFYDRIYAPVAVRRPGGPIPDWRQLSLGPQSVGYELTGPGRTLVIGGGGGRDIENALSSGQERVDVIELNRAIRDAVDQDLRRWSGAPYSLPGVSVDIGDGRSRLAARDTRYDVIHIGFTDTLSANSAAGFALTEANLYTVEAYAEYFDHLKPGGILNVTRLHRLVGDEALRATVLALEALEREGVEHPERNVVVLLGHDIFNELFGTVLARREPWSDAELARIRTLARERGDGVAFAPGGPYRLEWADLARAPDHESFCRDYRLAHGRTALLLQHDAPFRAIRQAAAGLLLRHRPTADPGRDGRDPGRAVRARVRPAAPADAARRSPAGVVGGLLRRDRRRLPAARDRADPEVRAVPRLPHLCVVGRAVCPACLHRNRIAHIGTPA
jgi:hypothetical protein